MQISKTFLTFWAVALCAVLVSHATPDSEAQAKAREALRKKMSELEGPPISEAPAATAPATQPAPPPSAPAPAPAPVVEPKPKAAPKPVAQPKPPKPATAPKAVPVAPKPAPVATAPVVGVFQPYPPVDASPPLTTPEQVERMRESVRQKIAELNRQHEAAPAAAAVVLPAARTPLEPIPGPPSSIPASKEAQLAELLKKYQADAITPEQYHTERAKILAEP